MQYKGVDTVANSVKKTPKSFDEGQRSLMRYTTSELTENWDPTVRLQWTLEIHPVIVMAPSKAIALRYESIFEDARNKSA